MLSCIGGNPDEAATAFRMEEEHASALAVDYERGYGDDGPAQDLEDWVYKVREEVYGPEAVRE